MGVSRVRGTFNEVAGTITIGETIEESSVEAEVQAASVHTRNEGRDEHLRSADFFDVEKFPVWTFKSTAVRADGDEIELDGDLTLHGETRPVTLSGEFIGVTVNPSGIPALGLEASTEISRKDFGLTWNVALEAGGMMVSDKVKIELDVQLNPTACVLRPLAAIRRRPVPCPPAAQISSVSLDGRLSSPPDERPSLFLKSAPCGGMGARWRGRRAWRELGHPRAAMLRISRFCCTPAKWARGEVGAPRGGAHREVGRAAKVMQ